MAYENIITEMDGDLIIVTLKRPEKMNAINHQMRIDLLDCVRVAESDDQATRREVVAFRTSAPRSMIDRATMTSGGCWSDPKTRSPWL